jgi:hypothetical protein
MACFGKLAVEMGASAQRSKSSDEKPQAWSGIRSRQTLRESNGDWLSLWLRWKSQFPARFVQFCYGVSNNCEAAAIR